MGFLFPAGPQPYPRHHHTRRDAAALSPVAHAQARQLARAKRPLGLRGLRALHRMASGRHRPHRGGDGDLRRHGPAMSIAYLPREVEIVERSEESPSLFTLRLRLTDPALQAAYRYAPGQFNMLYLHGAGEIAISIVSDPDDPRLIDHTIRAVGRVTRGMQKLKQGDRLGLRGPYGRGWPMQEAEGRGVVVVTGGLGCAPVVSVINYIARRRRGRARVAVAHRPRDRSLRSIALRPATCERDDVRPRRHDARGRETHADGGRRAARHLAQHGAQHAMRARPLRTLSVRRAVHLPRRAGVQLRSRRRVVRRAGVLTWPTSRASPCTSSAPATAASLRS